MLPILKAMFSRKWILATLLVLAGSALCVRLAIWQWDRLQQRRAFNAHYFQERSLPPLDLNSASSGDLTGMEYRDATVKGSYDFKNQVALRNQYNDSIFGYHLLTPLKLQDGSAILVDRGWIPADGNATPADWRKYDVAGEVTLSGILRLGQTKPELGGVPDPALSPGQTRLDFWNIVNLERIALQVPYPLLPVYLQPNVDPADTTPPIPYQPVVDTSEGPHLGYAGQWLIFASLLFFGYPLIYLRKQIKPEK